MGQTTSQEELPTGWHKSVSLLEACRHAGHGMRIAFRTERNLKVQVVMYVVVLVLAWLLGLSFFEMALLILAATVVVTLEMINTAVERFTDIVEPKYSGVVRHIKDIAAGAVMVASVAAVVVGILLFLPPILLLLVY